MKVHATHASGAIHPRDLLRIGDLTRLELDHLLDLAERMRAEPLGWREAHAGMAVACYFAKPSTRTRISFEAAAYRLGLLPIMLRPDELQLARGESLSDTARVMSGYVAAIVVRTFDQTDIEQVATFGSVPTINALTDRHHPCQALADLLTLRQHFGSLEGLTLAYVGDGNNVAHSLMEAGALAGMHVRVATPAGHQPAHEVVEDARQVAELHGGSIELLDDPAAASSGADALYTDVWVSMGEEREAQERREQLHDYQVNGALMGVASERAVFMHCLPAHRGEEVTSGVIDGARSVVIQQAHNRLPTEQAVLHTLITGDWNDA
jgi:ornithine carbamoyltransferase